MEVYYLDEYPFHIMNNCEVYQTLRFFYLILYDKSVTLSMMFAILFLLVDLPKNNRDLELSNFLRFTLKLLI